MSNTTITSRIPEIVYFATYVAIADKRIYDSEWFRIEQYIEENGFSNDVRNNALSIVKDLENRIPLEIVVDSLSKMSYLTQREALKLAVKIAYADKYYSHIENDAITQFCKKAKLPSKFLEIEKYSESARLEEESKEFQKVLSLRYRNQLLTSADYNNQLAYIEMIANEDISYVKNAIERITAQLQLFPPKLDSLLHGMLSFGKHIRKEEKEELKKVFQSLIDEENTLINNAKNNLNTLLDHQNASSARYTISFMGRTKAGKSTLHSILLGGINNDFIGRGSERTTRYNYIYDFNGIRIIDTPGIGAPGGAEDTSVAESVADESDLICYLVTTDSIQEAEFNFLEKLKNRHKPVFILLNKKENFNRTKNKREDFISDPLRWYTREDEQSIQGHLDRINTYVRKNHHYHNYSIIPVHLLAAKESLFEKDQHQKQQLLQGSRINAFLESLYDLIDKNGIVQKSHTIYRAGSYWNEDSRESIEKQIETLKTEETIIGKNYNECKAKIEKVVQKTREELHRVINNVFEIFKSDDVRKFVYDHYNDNKKKLNTSWKIFVEDSQVKEKAQREATRVLDNFQETVETFLEEMEENINLQMEIVGLPLTKAARVVDVKFIMDVAGSGIGIAAAIITFFFPPIGTALFVLAGIMGFISLFLKSKDEKISEAQNKLFSMLCASIDEQGAQVVANILKGYDNTCKTLEQSIDTYYGVVLKSLNKTYSLLRQIGDEQERIEHEINRCLGIRIVNYLTKEKIDEKDRYSIKSNLSHKQLNVQCEMGKSFLVEIQGLKKNDLVKSPNILQTIMEEKLIVRVED